jgi:outer membrane immunogenic protein
MGNLKLEGCVKSKSPVYFLMVLILFASGFAPAQSKEASVNYSLIVYNPAKSLAGDRDLNGGGGSFGLTYGQILTLKGEFQGYATTTLTYHLPPTTNSPGGMFSTQGNMFTYLFGPQFNYVMTRKRLFGEALFGGAYTNAYANLFKAAEVTGLSANINGFAMAFGGGFDLGITKHVAVRPVQIDYFMTRYEWKSLGINNQSNFRYQAGLVFAFGSSR